jgi:hypothetical protein
MKQEPTEASGRIRSASAVGILAACGGENVKTKPKVYKKR